MAGIDSWVWGLYGRVSLQGDQIRHSGQSGGTVDSVTDLCSNSAVWPLVTHTQITNIHLVFRK